MPKISWSRWTGFTYTHDAWNAGTPLPQMTNVIPHDVADTWALIVGSQCANAVGPNYWIEICYNEIGQSRT